MTKKLKKSLPTILNKKAGHDYSFLEKLEVGIVLKGNEVKSIRNSQVTLKGSFARIENEECWLMGCHITPYAQANTFQTINPTRDRKLLLHKRELKRWMGKVQEKGLTIVPIKLYFKKNHVKLEIALAQAKKLHDKREKLKEKSIQREIQKQLKRY